MSDENFVEWIKRQEREFIENAGVVDTYDAIFTPDDVASLIVNAVPDEYLRANLKTVFLQAAEIHAERLKVGAYGAAAYSDARRYRDALLRLLDAFYALMEDMNVGASFLQAETIREMNEAPIQAENALRNWREARKGLPA